MNFIKIITLATPPPPHLDNMLLFRDGLVRHLEAQRVLQSLHQQQITTLKRKRSVRTHNGSDRVEKWTTGRILQIYACCR